VAATVFAAGIWVAGHVTRSSTLWAGAAALLVACAVAAVMARSVRLARIASILALVCTGALARVDAPVSRAALPPAEFLNGQPVEIEGYITGDSALRPGNGQRERFDLETVSIRLGSRTLTQPIGIRATAFVKNEGHDAYDAAEDQQPGAFPQLSYGDRVRCVARLRAPRNFHNPGAFDYEGYLRGLGITALGQWMWPRSKSCQGNREAVWVSGEAGFAAAFSHT
jgi:hypothetical protein